MSNVPPGKVVSFIKRRPSRRILARAANRERDPKDWQVWAICPYIGDRIGECRGCPEHEIERNEIVKRGCRALAEEAFKVSVAAHRMEERMRMTPNDDFARGLWIGAIVGVIAGLAFGAGLGAWAWGLYLL